MSGCTRTPGAFQPAMMSVESDGAGICRFTPEIGNDGVGMQYVTGDAGSDRLSILDIAMGLGNNGVFVRSVLMSVSADHICVYPKFSLEAGS